MMRRRMMRRTPPYLFDHLEAERGPRVLGHADAARVVQSHLGNTARIAPSLRGVDERGEHSFPSRMRLDIRRRDIAVAIRSEQRRARRIDTAENTDDLVSE